MPLHRDIFWVGKQWSVTGHGMQAIDQKLKGKFDIEVSRIWDDDLHDALSDEKWFNPGDFDKGLAEARKHYPQPADRPAPKARPVLVAPPPPDDSIAEKDEPKTNPSPSPSPSPNPNSEPNPKANQNAALADFSMRIIGCRAKFVPSWRVRIR
jgi:hypothetical protein